MTSPGEVNGVSISDEIMAALAAAATTLDPTPTAEIRGDRQAWSRGGQAFAIAEGTGASFRLGTDIAAAAMRTPDVESSGLGPDWVRFSPPTLDDHARDRLVAWIAAAHRRATPASR